MVIVLTLCDRNAIAAVIVDMSENNDCLRDARIEQALSKLSQQHAMIYIGGEELNWVEDAIVYQLRDDNIIGRLHSILRRIEWDYSEFETIVLSNNMARIDEWHAINHSVVYLHCGGQLSLNSTHTPDEIWSIDMLEKFVENQNFVRPFKMECVGIEDGMNVGGTTVSMMKENKLIDIKYSVIFAGRYFKENDPRHYIHPLSRAILQFKRVVNDEYGPSGARKAILRIFAKVVERFIQKAGDVSLVTAVPSRPNKQHRFYGFDKFYQGDAILDFSVLESVSEHRSPKFSRSYEEKYECVKNAFRATKRVQGHVVLVDDVYTTGVTTSECVRMLLAAGAEKVTVIPIAHTQAYSANLYTLNGEFDNAGNEYKMVFNRTNGKALWKREGKEGYREQGDVVAHYLKQNKAQNYSLPEPDFMTQLYNIKAVIFDLDDTLVYTKELGDFRNQFIRPDKDTIYNFSHTMISPNDVKLLQECGVKVGIVTRSVRAYAEAVLEAYDYPYDVLVARYDCERTKPYGDPFISCMRRLQVGVESILAIGNEATDTEASESVGIYTVEIGRTHTIKEVQRLIQDIIEVPLPF